jgi:hypothetical protein
MQEENFYSRIVPDPLGPDPERALRRMDRNHLDATGENIIPTGGVEISAQCRVSLRRRRSDTGEAKEARCQESKPAHMVIPIDENPCMPYFSRRGRNNFQSLSTRFPGPG